MAKLPKPSLGFALSATLLPLICFSYVSASHARIGGHWNDALIDEGTFDSEPKLDSSEHPGLEVNRQSDATAPVECGHHFLNPGQSMTIKSKNYPGKHPIRYTCKWFFQGTSRDSTISMTCNDFQLQGEEYGCLRLRGGGLKTKTCNSVNKFEAKSDNDRLKASFSTRRNAGFGFQCIVTASDSSQNSEYWTALDNIRESVDFIKEKVMTNNPCKPNWKYFENSCYFFSTAEVPWQVGRESCLRINSDLVKISTQEEFDFIRSYSFKDDMWIGLNDMENEGNFTWISDGTPLEDWQNQTWWNSDAPSNSMGRQHCVEILDADLMDDNYCNSDNHYVCEMDV